MPKGMHCRDAELGIWDAMQGVPPAPCPCRAAAMGPSPVAVRALAPGRGGRRRKATSGRGRWHDQPSRSSAGGRRVEPSLRRAAPSPPTPANEGRAASPVVTCGRAGVRTAGPLRIGPGGDPLAALLPAPPPWWDRSVGGEQRPWGRPAGRPPPRVASMMMSEGAAAGIGPGEP